MILYHGKIYDNSEQNRIISKLKEDLYHSIQYKKPINRDEVIEACDSLAKKVLDGKFDDIVKPFLKTFSISYERFLTMAMMFSREGLSYKCKIELSDEEKIIADRFVRKIYPLGMLLHIAAGNVDGLPAYSVVEGLLSGNINILKLPSGDTGLSIRLLSELIKINPALADYIYVFDIPSVEFETIKSLAKLSDAIVVWGGDEAVCAIKSMADITTKVISWGHKLSFAYAVTEATDEDLKGLAKHICETNQVLCSSCQGIFLDTSSKEEQIIFAKRFFEILKQVNKELGLADYGMRAQNAIRLYTEKLENHLTANTIFMEDGVSVVCSDDNILSLSYMFRNVWVKRLAHEDIIPVLKPYKNHLQTVGILCPDLNKRKSLIEKFALAGLVRITEASEMSRFIPGEAHDGLYPLREYSRIVEIPIY